MRFFDDELNVSDMHTVIRNGVALYTQTQLLLKILVPLRAACRENPVCAHAISSL